jgi:hypothetical protein
VGGLDEEMKTAPPSAAPGVEQQNSPQSATQALVDNFRANFQTGRAAGILPIRVSFPTFGPSLFLVSELTSENQAPSITLGYQQEKKGGAK